VEEFKSLYDTEYSHRAVREVFQEHERQRLSKFICLTRKQILNRSAQMLKLFSKYHYKFYNSLSTGLLGCMQLVWKIQEEIWVHLIAHQQAKRTSHSVCLCAL